MYIQEVVEVAIGVIFAWLLISLATMQVQEIIARLLKKRARDLEKAIKNMLDDDSSDFIEFANGAVNQAWQRAEWPFAFKVFPKNTDQFGLVDLSRTVVNCLYLERIESIDSTVFLCSF